MSQDPFAAIRRALAAPPEDGSEPAPALRLDPGRRERTGIPEVVLAERKTSEEVALSLMRLAEAQGRAIASRLRPDQAQALPGLLGETFDHNLDEISRTAVIWTREFPEAPRSGGRIAIFSAGASDRPIAREATIMAVEMGCDVVTVADVGVAGLHRLVRPLERVAEFDPHAVIVAAGMDGALPSVIAGLVPYPVIGLPVSVGYGYGGAGTGALMSMLQSCAPGLAVVNIDNGIGAGAMAALIANRAANAGF
ncbi:MAG TPA: nickel pincer cofactor biosynthesis protein LarB [Thermomicrobiales bacterium]|nr:nickel pincer cofactor biosynthesis protein LarB [Thermomicrobiales bacterium]